MKNEILLVAVLVLSACGGVGGDSFVGAVHESAVVGGKATRHEWTQAVSVTDDGTQLTLDGLDDVLIAKWDEGRDTFSFQPQGNVMGGQGQRTGTSLRFTVWLKRGHAPYGFRTLQFTGTPGEMDHHETAPITTVPTVPAN